MKRRNIHHIPSGIISKVLIPTLLKGTRKSFWLVKIITILTTRHLKNCDMVCVKNKQGISSPFWWNQTLVNNVSKNFSSRDLFAEYFEDSCFFSTTGQKNSNAIMQSNNNPVVFCITNNLQYIMGMRWNRLIDLHEFTHFNQQPFFGKFISLSWKLRPTSPPGSCGVIVANNVHTLALDTIRTRDRDFYDK